MNRFVGEDGCAIAVKTSAQALNGLLEFHTMVKRFIEQHQRRSSAHLSRDEAAVHLARSSMPSRFPRIVSGSSNAVATRASHSPLNQL
jgi:hypothetical protein